MAFKMAPIKIAFAAEGTAKGTMPAAGTEITYASTWSSWSPLANDLDEGDVNCTFVKEFAIEKGPHDQAPLYRWIFAHFIESIMFALYELSKSGLAYDTAMTESSGTVTPAITETMVAILVEWRGIGVLWCPSVSVDLESMKGQSNQAKGGANYKVTPFGYSGANGGFLFYANGG